MDDIFFIFWLLLLVVICSWSSCPKIYRSNPIEVIKHTIAFVVIVIVAVAAFFGLLFIVFKMWEYLL